MARATDPNSANSQFFICFADASLLNGKYTVIGEVVSGMDVVDKLKKAPAGSQSGSVTDPDKMVKVQVAADVKYSFTTAREKSTENMADPENTLKLETTKGDVVIAMRPDLAPGHVARIKELVREGFYDGIVFHRVIDGFMAQTGCPQGTGTGGSGKKLKAEFNAEPHVRGTVLDGARAEPGFRRQPVLHLLRRRARSSTGNTRSGAR